MIIQGQVGPIASTSSIASGTQATARMGNMGELIASELHGRYYEATYRNTVFLLSGGAAAGAAAAITAYTGSSAGTPMLAIYNPVGSGKNAVILKATVANVVAATTAGMVTWGLYFGQTAAITQATTVTPTNCATLGTSGSVVTGFRNAALTSSTAATNVITIGAFQYVVTTPTSGIYSATLDLEGSLIIPPGSYAALGGSLNLTPATWTGSLQWEEVPI